MNKTIYLLLLLLLSASTHSFGQQPERIWSTYYGNFDNWGNYIKQRTLQGTIVYASAYDHHSGYLYVAGSTTDSTGIATPNAHKSHFKNNPHYHKIAFLAKFDTLGNRIWSTYHGLDSITTNSVNIILDDAGNIYLSGTTNADMDIATPGSHQPIYPGEYQGLNRPSPFLIKFNSGGEKIWGTYYGNSGSASNGGRTTSNDGSNGNVILGIACDPADNSVYVCGTTLNPSGIATPGSFKEHKNPDQGDLTDNQDAFLVKFDSSGVRQWGTYYGGAKKDFFNSLWIDSESNIHILGTTSSDTGIATPGADMETLPSAVTAFMVKFNKEGQRQWGTYVGNNFYGFSITGTKERANGATENVIYLNGYTSNNEPENWTPGSHQSQFGGGIVRHPFSKI